MELPLLDFGGPAPLVHFQPANGFPPATYRPLFDLLARSCHIVCVPPRPLWPGAGEPPAAAGTWEELADDLLAGLRAHNLTDVIAVGHSFGGVASLLAALKEPERFRALALLDPTILPPSTMAQVREAREQGNEARFALVEGALRRRSRFSSEAEAYVYFRSKQLFADWPETALGYYAAGAVRAAADGEGLELAWSGAWEAYYYRSIYADTWSDLPRLDGRLPTLVVAGETSDTFTRDSALLMRKVLPRARHEVVRGYGHLFPHAAPEETARVLKAWIDTVSGKR